MIVNILCVHEMNKNAIYYIHTPIYTHIYMCAYIYKLYIYIHLIKGLLTLLLNFSILLHTFYVLDTNNFLSKSSKISSSFHNISPPTTQKGINITFQDLAKLILKAVFSVSVIFLNTLKYSL